MLPLLRWTSHPHPLAPAAAAAGKPIASLAFHVSADVLAIACGHKLYIWEYTVRSGVESVYRCCTTAQANASSVRRLPEQLPPARPRAGSLPRMCAAAAAPPGCQVPNKLPTIVLKTRRSMRAVHFHPHGAPLVLTAEVQDPSPTGDLTPSLSEGGGAFSQLGGSGAARPRPGPPAAQQQQQQQEQQHAAGSGGGRAPTQPPPSQEVPFPSPQLLRGASPGPAPAAALAGEVPAARRVYINSPEGPVPMEIGGAGLPGGVFPPAQQPSQAELLAGTPAFHWRAPISPAGGSRPAAAAHQQQQEAGGIQRLWGVPSAAAGLAGMVPQPPHPPGGGRPAEEPLQALPAGARSPGWVPPGSAELPPSMVPLGWELPFPSNLQEPFAPGAAAAAAAAGDARQGEGWQPAAGGAGGANPASLPHIMAAFSAAAWNIIGEEQPPRVRLRLWR